jgi:methyl-accepting chemotaxis protein
MAMMCFAMWLQDSSLASTNHLIMIFIGLVAVAMTVMAIAMIVVAITAAKAIKGLTATADELKGKVLPLIDVATDISKTGQSMMQDAAPKVKHITDALVDASDTLAETSKAARSAVQQFDNTITDVNQRTQRQVARVDGMVTSALTATVDAVETISRGIKVPTQKIVAFAGQAKLFAEGLLARIRSASNARSEER